MLLLLTRLPDRSSLKNLFRSRPVLLLLRSMTCLKDGLLATREPEVGVAPPPPLEPIEALESDLGISLF